MYRMKSLVYLASREALYHCSGIIESFTQYSHFYRLCDRYQGCVREPSARKDHCCVCRFRKEYYSEDLHNVKRNSFKLEMYYLNILRDLSEILSVDPTVCFWEHEYSYQFRSWRTCLRGGRNYLFSWE